MVYIAFTYSILLLLSTYYGYKKGMGISRISLAISSLLFLSTFLHLIFLNTFLKTLISILLLLISVSYFLDRKKSKKQIHYPHHCIRLIFHVFIIYFLYHQFKIKLLPAKKQSETNCRTISLYFLFQTMLQHIVDVKFFIPANVWLGQRRCQLVHYRLIR